ncbi:hypothetical protein MM300_12715 [Evansella sp. LMS18]|jgi:hypothetical protein|uniref:hypothetical protein n=1 Tax=Evansella sp. LMS18 TaxID=2924033 RepID=UPI0020D0620D|nr:hypothetical protein [Evansella sp. LMS18]UTR08799.1 hypothetical protein MM300_12715 [Evansella sp. LMS18]
MERKVIAVLDSLDEKDEYIKKLQEMDGVSEDDLEVISKKDPESDMYHAYFKRGDYVLTVQADHDLAESPSQKRGDSEDSKDAMLEEPINQSRGEF